MESAPTRVRASEECRLFQVLLQRGFSRQFICDDLADFRSLFSGFDRRLACAVVLNRDGSGFGSYLIQSGIVCVQKADGDVPVVWTVCDRISPKLVVRNQTLFFLFLVNRFQILGDVIPEGVALPGLEVDVDDSPDWTGSVEGALGRYERCEKQRDNKQCHKKILPHEDLLRVTSLGWG